MGLPRKYSSIRMESVGTRMVVRKKKTALEADQELAKMFLASTDDDYFRELKNPFLGAMDEQELNNLKE